MLTVHYVNPAGEHRARDIYPDEFNSFALILEITRCRFIGAHDQHTGDKWTVEGALDI